MAIKNILVALDGSEGARAALRLGVRMAEKYGAHLTGLLPHGQPPAQIRRLLVQHAALREVVAEQEARTMAAAEAAFRAETGHLERAHWLTREAAADEAIVEEARTYDITLLGQHDPARDETAFALHPDRIALQSGRPIIVVPPGYDRPLGDAAALAWDGQRAAARALSDAMQILETKALVTVVTVAREPSAMEPSVNRLSEHLRRHGVTTEWVSLAPVAGSVSQALTAWCREAAPPLLVMGAYEHSKFREDLVGGVTNAVLRQAPMPVLMAH